MKNIYQIVFCGQIVKRKRMYLEETFWMSPDYNAYYVKTESSTRSWLTVKFTEDLSSVVDERILLPYDKHILWLSDSII